MDLLSTLIKQAQDLDEESFTRRHEGLYLLGQYPAPEEDMWSFSTDIRSFDHAPGAPRGLSSTSQAPLVRFVLRVEKTDRNTWRRRISVGRATNNDLIIRHESVSKLHAHFHYGSNVRLDQSHDATLMIDDVGSANGTRVNDRALKRDKPKAVHVTDRIAFGEIKCRLLDATGLYHAIKGPTI